jgi:hypothetical protein
MSARIWHTMGLREQHTGNWKLIMEEDMGELD